jgi:hypothetical protein
MNKEKQIRMVCHLEFKGEHYYFGNLKVLTDNFSKGLLGVSYKSLANHFTKHSEFSNACCIIRKGQLVTTARNKKDKPEV